MGIKGLTKLLGDNAASCAKAQDPHFLMGRKIAIDASMCIYQLLVAVRGTTPSSGLGAGTTTTTTTPGADNLTNDSGSVTSHLSGLLYRGIRLLELGAKPIFVFDGAPPSLKAGELQKRTDAKKAAQQAADEARDAGDLEAAAKYARRVNTITPDMLTACKTLLTLMGIPIVEAPCEAEAQCAELVKSGKAYATASEDMDSLTFGTTRLIRQLWQGTNASASKKGIRPTEYTLDVALTELDLTMLQFVDMCILCGCDYVNPIKGVGPVKALNLVRKHENLENIVATLRKEKKKGLEVPEEYPVEEVRRMFTHPVVTSADDVVLKWTSPKTEQLKTFLVADNQFDETKVDNAIKRLLAARKGATQVRVDSFFTKKQPPGDAAKKKAQGAAVTTPNGKGKVAKKDTTTTTTTTGKKRPSTSSPATTKATKKAKK